MSVTEQPVYSAPFDAVAARYDETFTSSLIGQAQRAAVWRELEQAFHPGNRVLEIGCGTGVDACFLAERGVQVVACDSSPEMIAVTSRRIRQKELQKLVQPLLVRAEDVAPLASSELFDGAFSNFGVLNCVDDLRKSALDLSGLLKPGTPALLCWMGPACLWEMLWYLAQGNARKAFRRLKHDGITAEISAGAFVRVQYPSVRLLTRAFAPEFRLKSVKGIGVCVPPSYVEALAERHPHLLRVAERADSWLARFPGFRTLGDHVLVRLQRERTIPQAGER